MKTRTLIFVLLTAVLSFGAGFAVTAFDYKVLREIDDAVVYVFAYTVSSVVGVATTLLIIGALDWALKKHPPGRHACKHGECCITTTDTKKNHAYYHGNKITSSSTAARRVASLLYVCVRYV